MSRARILDIEAWNANHSHMSKNEGPIRRIARVEGLSYKDIAERVDLAPGYVAQLACGLYQPGRVAAEKISAEFGHLVTLVELLTWKPDRKSGEARAEGAA